MNATDPTEICGHMPVPGLVCRKPKDHRGFGHASGDEPTATTWPDGPDCRDAGNSDAYLTGPEVDW